MCNKIYFHLTGSAMVHDWSYSLVEFRIWNGKIYNGDGFWHTDFALNVHYNMYLKSLCFKALFMLHVELRCNFRFEWEFHESIIINILLKECEFFFLRTKFFAAIWYLYVLRQKIL